MPTQSCQHIATHFASPLCLHIYSSPPFLSPHLESMAKTKQTAKKSTGGTATNKKITLRGKTGPKTSKTPQSHQPSKSPVLTPDVEMAEASTPGLDVSLQVANEEGTSDDEDGDDVSHYRPGIEFLAQNPTSGAICALMGVIYLWFAMDAKLLHASDVFQALALSQNRSWTITHSSVSGVLSAMKPSM